MKLFIFNRFETKLPCMASIIMTKTDDFSLMLVLALAEELYVFFIKRSSVYSINFNLSTYAL